MSWTRAVDAYCERLDAGYWAEPVNALTNAAFVLAAIVMWRRLKGRTLPLAHAMTGVLAFVGLGSFLFHTHAQAWAGLADVVPILGFVLLYLYAANRDFLDLSRGWALIATAAFVPFAALLTPLFALVPGLGGSAGYAPLPVLIAGYALALRRHSPTTARGLAIGAAILCLSILMRSLDGPLCGALPLGTHFAWHLLNALMLGWMIEVYRRHVLAGARADR